MAKEFEEEFGEFEEEFGEFEGSFGEMEAPATQKNWYYFDAWRRAADGSVSRMAKYGPRQETESDASRLFDVFCLNNQNAGQGSGKVLTRCYQWFPVSSRWVACKNVVGFKRGMCSSDELELGEFEFEAWESSRLSESARSPAPQVPVLALAQTRQP